VRLLRAEKLLRVRSEHRSCELQVALRLIRLAQGA
jgi:hypothetical protein